MTNDSNISESPTLSDNADLDFDQLEYVNSQQANTDTTIADEYPDHGGEISDEEYINAYGYSANKLHKLENKILSTIESTMGSAMNNPVIDKIDKIHKYFVCHKKQYIIFLILLTIILEFFNIYLTSSDFQKSVNDFISNIFR